jgi:Tfp pilus assembly protein PilF
MTLMELGALREFSGGIGVRLRSSITAGGTVARGGSLIAALCLCCSLVVIVPVQSAADEGLLGHVEFEVSCNRQAQATFNEAVAWLHSFEYERAGATFGEVLDRDPSCSMAYWGMAQSLWHQLWVTPPSQADFAKGAEYVRRAQALTPKSDRERGYIEAIRAFYSHVDEHDHRRRALAYQKAMGKLHSSHPEDREATIFYALALLATASPTDKTFENQLKAGALLEALLDNDPEHPGITHYIIHSYDYPELADKALQAARRYAEIAPASAHANHMPSHIFTRRGLWQESIATNLNAAAAGKAFAQAHDITGRWDEEIHAVSYLMYAYLQGAEDTKAREILEDTQTIEAVQPVGIKAAYPFASNPARFVLERHAWRDAAVLTELPEWFPWERYPAAQAITYFTRALGAARMGDPEQAKTELKMLRKLRQALPADASAYWHAQLEVQTNAADAWIAHAEGRAKDALTLMRSAADLEDSVDKLPITPGEVLPARELLADMLLEQDDAARAFEEYEAVLRAAPNRFNALFGAGVAADRMGDRVKANFYYEALITQSDLSGETRPALVQALEYLSAS